MRRDNLDDLKAELCSPGRLEALAEGLLGTPNKETRSKSEWRWGAKGSAALVVRDGRGRRRGSFFTHEAAQGGSPLDMIMFARSCSIAEAISYAKTFLGWSASGHTPAPIGEAVLQERARKRSEQQHEAERDAEQKADYARRLHSEAQPVADTVAERYLVETRGIPKPVSGWPSCVGFHAGSRSLLLSGTTGDGEVRSVQRVFLTPAAGKISPEELEVRRLKAAKQTNGPGDGVAVRLPGDPNGPLLWAEGAETGLSVWAATRHETWIALGQLVKLTPPAGRLIVLCRDDDRPNKPGNTGPTADDRHRKLVADLRGRGLQVVTALPWLERRRDGSDFNDLLQAEGIEVVRARLAGVIPPDLPPEHTPPTLTLNEAMSRIELPLADFFREAVVSNTKREALQKRQKTAKAELKDWDDAAALDEPTVFQRQQKAILQELVNATPAPAAHHGLAAALGIGKTHAAAEALPGYLEQARATGIVSGVLWTTPTLDLADQTAAMLVGHGVLVGVYRGRRAPDPAAPTSPTGPNDDAGRMCLDLPAVRLAHAAGANVAETVCGPEHGEEHERCPHYAACPFQRNNKALRDRDVVVAAHNALIQELPAKVERGLGLTVIDEAFWQVGLSTSELSLDHLVDDLDEAPILNQDEPDHFATDRLRSTMDTLTTVLSQHEDAKPIAAKALHDAGLDAARCREASREQWRRMIKLDMRPGMPADERRAASRMAHTNRRIPTMAMLLKVVADVLDGAQDAGGRLELTTANLKAGPERRVAIHYLKGFAKARLERPILYLDATLPVQAARQYMPALAVVAEVDVITPHMRIVQVLSTRENRGGWGKNSVVPDKAPDEVERDRREGRLAQLGDFVTLACRRLGRGLVVTYKAVEDRFARLPNIATAHFNALAGLNAHEHVVFAVIIGRPMPNPQATADIVKQLFGRWPAAANPMETPAGLLMADGSRRTITTRRYIDADMEAVRRAITDDNVMQAIGRVRASRRTAENPVTVLLLSDVVTPFPLAGVTDWPSIALDRVDRMAVRGLILDSPTDAAKAYPDLFETPRAARDAFRADRRSSAQTPMFISIVGECALDQPVAKARYRPLPCPSEPKPKTRFLTVTDAARLPGLRAWLEALVGPLALFEVDPEPPAPSQPEPVMEEPDVLLAARIMPLPPEKMFPLMRADSPFVPIEGLWRVSRRSGPPRVVEERPCGFIAPRRYLPPPVPDFAPTPFEEILAMARQDAMLERHL